MSPSASSYCTSIAASSSACIGTFAATTGRRPHTDPCSSIVELRGSLWLCDRLMGEGRVI
eukprot:2200961-Prymnesium_polylepis.2